MAPVGDGVSLEQHGFRAEIAAAGATLARLDWTGPDGLTRPLLFGREAAEAGTAEPNRFGLWPMLPFANRAFGAVIDRGEERITLPINDPATGSTIHGFGWQARWRIVEARADRAVLVHERRAGDDPYRYRATLVVALRPGLVRIALGVTNLADRALPFGFGLHPWLPAAADTLIAFRAAGALDLGPGYRAGGVVRWDRGGPFARLRPLDRAAETALSLIGWDGSFRLETPSQRLAITLEAGLFWRHPLLWAPAEADFVCFEPQSHALGAPSEAIVRSVTPLATLEPGEGLWDTMTLTPDAI